MAKEPTQTAAEEDPQNPSQLQPYPTGNPPDPMEEYYKAHPERKLEAERAADEAKTERKAAVEVEAGPEEEAKEAESNSKAGKGRK